MKEQDAVVVVDMDDLLTSIDALPELYRSHCFGKLLYGLLPYLGDAEGDARAYMIKCIHEGMQAQQTQKHFSMPREFDDAVVTALSNFSLALCHLLQTCWDYNDELARRKSELN